MHVVLLDKTALVCPGQHEPVGGRACGQTGPDPSEVLVAAVLTRSALVPKIRFKTPHWAALLC
jgi:hypothetical protein